MNPIKKVKKRTCLIFNSILLINFFYSFSAYTQTDQTTEARKIWLQGFEIYEKAEATEKIGSLNEALKLYEESLVYFNRVQKNYPTWNTYLIEFRIKKCMEKINQLNATLRKTQAPQPTTQETKETPIQKDPEKIKLISQINALQKELNEANSKLQNAFYRIANLEKEALRGASAAEELTRLNKEKIELEKRLTLLSAELKKALEEKSPENLEAEKQKLKDELISSNNKVLEAERKITELSEILENTQKDVQNIKLQKTEAEYKLKQAEITSQNLTKKISDLEKNNESLRKNLIEQEKQINSLTKEIEKKNNTIQELSAKINELNESIKIASAKSDTAPLLEKIQLENKELENKLQIKEQELNKTLSKLNDTENLLKELSAKNERYERIITEQLNKINNNTDEINALQRKIQELNSNLNNITAENKSLTAKSLELNKLVEHLNEKILLSAKKDADYNDLLKYSTELEAKNKNLSEQIAKLESEINKLKEDASQSATNQQNVQQLNTALQQEVQKLKATIEQLNEQLNSSHRSLDEQNNKLALALAENEKLKSQIEVFQQKLEDSKKIEESLRNLQANSSNTAELLKKTIQDLNTTSTQLSTANKTIRNLTEERKILIEKINELEKKLENSQIQSENLTKENNQYKKTIESLQNELDAIKKISEEKTNIAELKSQLNITTKQLSSAQDEIKKLKEQNNALRSRLEEKVAETVYPKAFKEEKDKLIATIKEKDEIISQLQKKINEKQSGSQSTQKQSIASREETQRIKPPNEKVSLLITAATDAEKHNDIESAIWHYQKIFEFEPDNVIALLNLARIFSEKNEKNKAEAYFIKINPDKLEPSQIPQYAKILLLLKPAEAKTATELYQKAVENGAPKDPDFEEKISKIDQNQ